MPLLVPTVSLLGVMVKAYPWPGGYTLGASIVTLPGNPKLAHIHEKSIPLMLEDAQIGQWLDRRTPNQQLDLFRDSRLAHTMVVQRWQSIKSPEPIAEAELIEASDLRAGA